MAFIVPDPDQPVTEETLRRFAAEQFADFEQPTRYRFLEELPRTKLGKVDFRALERMAERKSI